MKALANVNGDTMPLAEARVSPMDRGFLFGDAVYEVLRVYQGRPWLLEEHCQRLERSLQSIRIGGVDLPRLRRRMHETIAAGKFAEAIVYIQITRGVAPRMHPFPAGAVPLEFLYVQDYQDHYAAARQSGYADTLALALAHASLGESFQDRHFHSPSDTPWPSMTAEQAPTPAF